MGLYSPEIIALEFIRYFFFWLWPFPLRVDSSSQSFYLAEPTFRNWAPSLISAAWCFTFAQIGLLTAVYIHIKNKAEMIDSLVLVLLWYSLSAIDIIMIMLLCNLKLALNVINSGLEIEERFCEEYPAMKAQNSEGKWVTVVKFSIGPIVAVCVLVAPLAFVVIDKDPFYFILGEILGDPKYWEFWTIIGAVVIRIALIFSASLEIFRSGAYLYTIAMISFDRCGTILRGPIVLFKDVSRILKTHIESRLHAILLESLLQYLIYTIWTFFFWTTVMILWVCVECTPEQIGYLLYSWYATALTLLLFGGLYIATLACQMLSLENDSVKLNVLMAERVFMRNKSRKNKITLKRAKAIRPVQLKYGSFGSIDDGMVKEYGCLLFDRCIDALLMFDYNS